MKKKILCFDLDNVICSTTGNEYIKSKPKKNVIKMINEFHCTKKFIIKIFTARGMGTYDGNVGLVKKNLYKLTKNQLNTWKLNYDELVMGKISYDVFVDDKCFGFKKDWHVDFKKKYLKQNN
jgi:capsule biosynthesis phosphatase